MTKTKKTILWSVIGFLCVTAIAGTAIGVTYSQYREASTNIGTASIPKWDFDLTSSKDDSFDIETSAKLSPNQSAYTDGNTNRYSVSDPIAILKITNSGDVAGDLSINASINQTNPYNPNSKYVSNTTFEQEFLEHFSLTAYYSISSDGSNLINLYDNTIITLFPESDLEQDDTLYNYVYIYVVVTWLSDIDGINGDAFDTWVGRYIDSINISTSFKATQHGDFTPTQSSTKLGVQVSDYQCLYFDGTVDTNGHLNTTSNYDDAVDLIVTEIRENEYTLSFYANDVSPTSIYYASGDTLYYIGYSGSGTGFTISQDEYIWYYDDQYEVFYTYDSNDSQRFIGNQDGSDYLGCFSYTNINSSSYHLGSSFDSEPELQEPPSGPQVGDPTYKLGVLDSDTYKYFNGTINSNHMISTTTYEEAVDVYITGLNEGVDNTCTLSFYDDSGTLQYIASSENSSNMKLSTTPYTWTWADQTDELDGYFYTASFDNRFIGHQNTYDYFACYANSNVSSTSYNHVIPYTSDPDLIAPTSITITAQDDVSEIEVDSHPLQLYASIYPSSGVNQHVVWSSSDDSIASVSQDGLVAPISEGEVIIYASSLADETVKGEYSLTVVAASELVYKESETFVASEVYSSVTSGSKTLTDEKIYGDLVTIGFAKNGGSNDPSYYYSGLDLRIYAKNQIIFTPVDESIAEISKIELTYSTTYYGNDTATFTDSGGNEAGTLTNPKTSGGTITIDVSASGQVIYCNDYSSTSGGTQLRCTQIDVYYDVPNSIVPESISINGDTNEIIVGDSLQLSAEVLPETANQKISWISTDEDVASVSQAGLVKGLSEGETTIKATSILSDEIYGTYAIKVNERDLGGLTEVKIGTYDFTTKDETFSKANGSTSVMTATQLKDTLDAYWTSEDDYDNPLDSVTDTSYIYQYYTSGGLTENQSNYALLKTGGSSNNGTMNLTLNNTITKVEIDQQSWSTSENCTITVNDAASQTSSSMGVEQTLTFDITQSTDLSITYAKRCYIYSITLYGYVY